MDWKRYERIVVEKFRADFPLPHFRVEPSGIEDYYLVGRHSGVRRQIDAAVFRRNDDKPFLIADAKKWNSKIDITDVEKFIGCVEDVNVEIGLLITSAGFSNASQRRAQGASSKIELKVMTIQEALEFDWRSLGRKIFPWDWVFHIQIGRALRLIEENANANVIAETIEALAFEEWETYVTFAMQKHAAEAAQFLGVCPPNP